jgi:hypothetical protein
VGLGKEGRERTGHARLGHAGPRKRGGPGRERGEARRAWVGHAVQLGRARGKRGSSRPVMNFCFSFSKIPNNTSFCLFLCNLFRAPKMMKIFV